METLEKRDMVNIWLLPLSNNELNGARLLSKMCFFSLLMHIVAFPTILDLKNRLRFIKTSLNRKHTNFFFFWVRMFVQNCSSQIRAKLTMTPKT